jgi:hypothetical protein
MARAVRARPRQCRGRPLSGAARSRRRSRPRSWRPAGAISPTCRPRWSARPTAAAMRSMRPELQPQAAGLFPAELPLPDRRLSDRAFRQALRHPGRGAVFRQRQRHAAPVPRAAQRTICGVATSARCGCSTLPAARAASCALSSTLGRACGLQASICRKPIWPRRGIILGPIATSGLHAANAEAHAIQRMPRFDVVTSIYLFHEIPPEVRRIGGGRVRPHPEARWPAHLHGFAAVRRRGRPMTRLLESFPVSFHEPYFPSYTGEDLPGAVRRGGPGAGGSAEPVFLSKLVVCDKPAAQ